MPKVTLELVPKGAGGELIWEASLLWDKGFVLQRWGDTVPRALAKLATTAQAVLEQEQRQEKRPWSGGEDGA